MIDHVIAPHSPFLKHSPIGSEIILSVIMGAASLMMVLSNTSYANTTSVTGLAVTDSAVTGTAVERYNADFFMAFSPQTLYDILENIPGANSLIVAMNNAAQSRGFGSSGDQILINSKRVSGKENNIQKELVNIQAQDVDYIELIRGTRSDLDVQSNGLVINVVLKKHIEPSILWSLGGIKTSGLKAKPEFSAVYSAGMGDLKYRFGFSHNLSPTYLTITDQYTSPDQLHTDTYSRIRRNWYKVDQLSGKLEYTPSAYTVLQFNALLEKNTIDSDYTTSHENWLTSEQDKNAILFDYDRDKWELSGDISHQLNDQNQLKLLFISNSLDADDQMSRVLLLENSEVKPDYQLPRLYTATENVLRGNWKHQLNSRHSFDSGLEMAVNSLKENLQFISQSQTAYHSTEINDIQETRYEAFVHYNFTVTANLNLQSSLVYERSTMDVATDFVLVSETNDEVKNQSSRTFSYLKPRLNIRYDINDIYQMRFNYERTVSQLNLNDFVPGFNREETRLEETNPDLKPEMRDEFSFSVEKQWLNSNGRLTLTPYYHQISDLITEIPLAQRSGDGNVDKATEYGVALDTHFSLGTIGLDQTLISIGYTWRRSQMIHPFTGEKTDIERLSNNEWNVQLNQNELLPGLSFSLTLAKQSAYQSSRFDYQGNLSKDVTANIFFDYKINQYLKLRFQGDHLLNRTSVLHRTRHTGLYTETDILRYEQRSYQRAPRYSLSLTGQF
ncbi:MAG: TonB-dependent receptor plug domain-containing protein [Colwellia sp.]|nr:TonB-dependent receptor plug domain-containing protein [Colwellia sp.]